MFTTHVRFNTSKELPDYLHLAIQAKAEVMGQFRFRWKSYSGRNLGGLWMTTQSRRTIGKWSQCGSLDAGVAGGR